VAMDATATDNVQIVRDQPWDNFFRTVHVPHVARQYVVSGDLAEGVRTISAIVNEAARANVRVRPMGSSWSFSELVAPDGWMISLRGMRGMGPSFAAGSLAPDVDPPCIEHILGGTIIQEINETLESHRKSLHVMGGNGGQAIAGAIATGTHGGWIGCP